MTNLTHWLPPDGGWPPCTATTFETDPILWSTSHDETATTCPECLEWLAAGAERALDGGGHRAKSDLGRGWARTYCGMVVTYALLAVERSTAHPITCPRCQTAAWVEAVRTGAA